MKGVLTAEDGKSNVITLHLHNFGTIPELLCYVDHAARIAIQAGAAGIIVSNHGARQLDYVPATIMALEEVHPWDYN